MALGRLTTLSLLGLLLACSAPPPPSTSFYGIAMAMPYSVQLDRLNHPRSQIQARLNTIFSDVDAIYNHWNPDSELSQLNRREKSPLSPQLSHLLQTAAKIVKLSRGYFDPTYGHWHEMVLSKESLEKGSFTIDLDAIAKGHAVDLIAAELEELGYSNYCVEWAGEILCKGCSPSRRAWQIGLRDPAHPDAILLSLALHDQALATSGDTYNQIADRDGLRTHIYNPIERSWVKIEKGSIASITVSAPSCALADGIATAAMALGKEAPSWLDTLKEEVPELNYWIVYHD